MSGERKETTVTTKKQIIGTHQLEYEQGRQARRNAISKDEAPCDADTDALTAWAAGWAFEDKGQHAHETAEDAVEPKAAGQTATASKAKH